MGLETARQYIHAHSVGRPEEGAALYRVIDDFLSARYAEGAIDGYNLLLLPSAERCREEFVDDDWKKLVPERYPIVYVFIQPNSSGDAVFDPRLKAEGFLHVK